MKLSALFVVLLAGPVAVFLPDVWSNPETLKNLIDYSSSFIACSGIFIAFLVRLFIPKPDISKVFKLSFLFVFCIFFTASLLFTYLNYTIHPNFIYSLTRLNTDILMFVALTSGTCFLLSQSNNFYKKHYSQLLLSIPIVFAITTIAMLGWPLNAMSHVTGEDKIVENLQFFILIFGSWGAFHIFRKTFKKRRLISVIFIALSVILLLIAGDEISWGQRIFSIETPQTIQTYNTQGEATIHNLSFFDGLVPFGYVIIGLYGSIVSLFVRQHKRISFVLKQYLFPEAKYFLLFFLPALFNGYTLLFDHKLGNFSEPAELLLYTAVSLFVIETSKKKVI